MSLKTKLLELIVPALAADAEPSETSAALRGIIDLIEKYQPTPDEAPSEEFENAFGGYGTVCIDCGFCGRTNFDYNGEHMEEGELEELLAKQEKNPRGYHGHDGRVSYGHISGIAYVHRCPCNEARRYEKSFWINRRGVMDYLRARIAKRLKKAQGEQAAADRVTEDL